LFAAAIPPFPPPCPLDIGEQVYRIVITDLRRYCAAAAISLTNVRRIRRQISARLCDMSVSRSVRLSVCLSLIAISACRQRLIHSVLFLGSRINARLILNLGNLINQIAFRGVAYLFFRWTGAPVTYSLLVYLF